MLAAKSEVPLSVKAEVESHAPPSITWENAYDVGHTEKPMLKMRKTQYVCWQREIEPEL